MQPVCDTVFMSNDGITTKYQFIIEGYTVEIIHVNRPDKHIY